MPKQKLDTSGVKGASESKASGGRPKRGPGRTEFGEKIQAPSEFKSSAKMTTKSSASSDKKVKTSPKEKVAQTEIVEVSHS
jgi:hypothetical protein